MERDEKIKKAARLAKARLLAQVEEAQANAGGLNEDDLDMPEIDTEEHNQVSP